MLRITHVWSCVLVLCVTTFAEALNFDRKENSLAGDNSLIQKGNTEYHQRHNAVKELRYLRNLLMKVL